MTRNDRALPILPDEPVIAFDDHFLNWFLFRSLLVSFAYPQKAVGSIKDDFLGLVSGPV